MRRHEQLIAVCISTVLVMAGQGVIGPVLPLFARSFGVSTAMIGATVTAFGVARLVTNVPAGLVADRQGRRVLLIGGPLVTAVGMYGSGLASSIWVLLLFRFVAGLGSALYMTGAQIYLLDIAKPELRGRYIATNQGALLVGVGFGPALGGLLASRYSLSTPFTVVAVASVLTALYGYLRLPETRASGKVTDAKAGVEVAKVALLRSRNFLLVGLVTIGVFSVRTGVSQTLVPLELNGSYHLQVEDLGVVFTGLGIIGMVLIWPAGWATDRFGHRRVIIPTAVLIAMGCFVLTFATNLTAFVAGLAVMTFGSSISGPAPASYVADLVGQEQRGSAMGLYRTFGDLGIVVSPVLSGAVADAVSIPFAISMNGLYVLCAALAFLVFSTAAAAPDPVTPGAAEPMSR